MPEKKNTPPKKKIVKSGFCPECWADIDFSDPVASKSPTCLHCGATVKSKRKKSAPQKTEVQLKMKSIIHVFCSTCGYFDQITERELFYKKKCIRCKTTAYQRKMEVKRISNDFF